VQGGHPGLAGRRQGGNGVRVPARRRRRRRRSLPRSRSHSHRACCDLFFHVALDGVPVAAGDELGGCFGVGAIGDCIAGVDDVAVSECRAGLQRAPAPQRLQVAVGAAADQDRRESTCRCAIGLVLSMMLELRAKFNGFAMGRCPCGPVPACLAVKTFGVAERALGLDDLLKRGQPVRVVVLRRIVRPGGGNLAPNTSPIRTR
jgi:hypothetical protein